LAIFVPIFNILKDYKNIYFLHSIILFFVFFSFNIPSVSHYILLMFCLGVVGVKGK
jgi:hypothetical protein